MVTPDNAFPHLQAVLQEYGVALRNAYQDNLIRSDRIASGELLNSIEVRVERPDAGTWAVIFNLEQYWKWVEGDTKPHWPPRSAILAWIKAKPVLPRPDKRGHVPRPESLAFLIQRKISKVGTKGTHDLEHAKTELLPQFYKSIGDALLQDVSDQTNAYILDAFRDINPAPVEI